MKHSTLIRISGLIWSIVGLALTTLGLIFLFKAHSLFLLFIALPLGYIKGRTVLKKSALRQLARLTALKKPLLKDLFGKGYLILLGVMFLLGFLLRYCPLALRGTIDIAVGFGLIVGSSYYYKKEFAV